METGFVISLKPGTQGGEIENPQVPPQVFTVEIPPFTTRRLMRGIKIIVGEGKVPMVNIRFHYKDGPVIVESDMTPVIFTETPGVYPLKRK